MAETIFERRSAFAHLLAVGRHGAAEGAPGLTVREVTGLALASIIARRGRRAELAAAVRAAFGLNLPSSPAIAAGEGVSFVFAGPDQWLAVAEPERLAALAAEAGRDPARAGGAVFTDRLRTIAGSACSVADQSDGRGVVRLSGPRVRDVLAKGLAIDLHPRSFRPAPPR